MTWSANPLARTAWTGFNESWLFRVERRVVTCHSAHCSPVDVLVPELRDFEGCWGPLLHSDIPPTTFHLRAAFHLPLLCPYKTAIITAK